MVRGTPPTSRAGAFTTFATPAAESVRGLACEVSMPKKKRKEPAKRGPVPERLKIEEPWGEAVRKALKKKRPPEGWPKPGKEST